MRPELDLTGSAVGDDAATSTASRVDYVVVAFRSAGDLASCLDAISADRPAGASIFVVDNASPDDSAAIAERHPSKPRLIRSHHNVGFGRACNLAVERSSADLIFLVNPDARLEAGTTTLLRLSMDRDRQIGAAGPRIVDPRGAMSAASAGFEPTIRSAIGHFLLLARAPLMRRIFPPFQLPGGWQAGAVGWVSGAAMMVRREAYRRVKGFDVSFFLYAEDLDLCRRLRSDGWVVWYQPSAVVEHALGGSQGPEQSSRWFVALHDYVAREHGRRYARIFSVIAALGLGMRAALTSGRSPAHARRLAVASITAARCAAASHR